MSKEDVLNIIFDLEVYLCTNTHPNEFLKFIGYLNEIKKEI